VVVVVCGMLCLHRGWVGLAGVESTEQDELSSTFFLNKMYRRMTGVNELVERV
jgi:hypothetical protein